MLNIKKNEELSRERKWPNFLTKYSTTPKNVLHYNSASFHVWRKLREFIKFVKLLACVSCHNFYVRFVLREVKNHNAPYRADPIPGTLFLVIFKIVVLCWLDNYKTQLYGRKDLHWTKKWKEVKSFWIMKHHEYAQ